MKQKIFATGMGGCVGHYLFEELQKHNDFEYIFLIRNPQKVKYDLSNVKIIQDEFKYIKKYSDVIKDCDYIIHLLADWGGEEGNFQETLDLFDCINSEKVKKILYFSTASILGKDGIPSPITKFCGTPYIRGKYKFYEVLKTLPHYNKTTILYLTWLLSGGKNYPESHANSAIKTLAKWIDIIKFFSIDINFHFIHAKDIATIATYLLKNNTKENEFILGNEAISANYFIEKLCIVLNKKNPKIKIPVPIDMLAKIVQIFGKKLSDWDKYCIENRKNTYQTVNPTNFGLKPAYLEIQKVLEEIFSDKDTT